MQIVRHNEQDLEFVAASRSHRFRVKILSWGYVICYTLICVYISLAAGENLVDRIGWEVTYLMVIVAFILSGLSVIMFVLTSLIQVLILRAKLQSMERSVPNESRRTIHE